MRRTLSYLLIAMVPVLVLSSCAPNVGVQLLVSPEALDFGQNAVSKNLYVAKNYTSTAMSPLVVSTDRPWIEARDCTSTSERCISSGPADKIRIRVSINRNRLDLGLNLGNVVLASGTTASVTVPIVVDEIAKADFTARQHRVSLGRVVEFLDTSTVLESAGNIKSWRWDFGDGNVSTSRNPVHVYNQLGAFTVSLTIETTRGITRRAEKQAFIFVDAPPVTVDFEASQTNIEVGETITFTDISTLNNARVNARRWEFGDGNTSTQAFPSHTYASAGIYSVSLTLFTTAGEFSATKENYIVVREPQPFYVDFTYDNPYLEEDTQFFPIILGEIDEENVGYLWDFGDGGTSNDKNPTHRYRGKGSYEVILTVADGTNSAKVQKTIEIRYRPPQALFTAQPTRQTKGRPINFTDRSIAGFGNIISRKWTFGDGNTSTEANPIHSYSRTGKYTVSLEVMSDDPDRQTATLTRKDYIEIVDEFVPDQEILDLDRYVNAPDDCFKYPTPTKQFVILEGQPLATAYIINKMTSQCWDPDDMVAQQYVEWVHPVTIYEPKFKLSDVALLFIDGGSRTSSAELEEIMAQLSILSGTTIVHLKNVPSQPIVFEDEIVPKGEEDNYLNNDVVLRSRTEDEIIAYSYEKYMRSYRDTQGNPTYNWPVLFPMVKAAVRTMDITEQILARDGISLKGFVVAGASKRGWTTWLTGAVDSRITAIGPIVINVLNMKPHLEHHRASYGYWSPAIYDYAQKGIFDQLISGSDGGPLAPEAQALLERVDPYQYALRGRYPMPKFMLNATGDEFFVPDTTQFYFDDLQPQKHLCYIPNVGHGMGGLDEEDLTNPASPAGKFLAWYMAVSQGRPLPEFKQYFDSDGAIRVEVDTKNPPLNVWLWSATAEGVRDFRQPKLGPKWTFIPLTPTSPGVYRARPPEPEPGNYTAFFIELEYTNPAQFSPLASAAGFKKPNFVFTTGVRVVPVNVDGSPVYPNFVGYIANSERSDVVNFTENELPVVVLYGSPEEMGRDYGELLASSINNFIPAYVRAVRTATGLSQAALLDTWNTVSTVLDKRVIEELNGLVTAPGINVPLADFQAAHAAFLHTNGLWDASSVLAYKEFLADRTAGHSATINDQLGIDLANHLCAILYIPNKGAPHTVLTYSGLVFGYTGINLGGISMVETPDPDAPANTANSLSLMRSVLYDAFSLRDAIEWVEANPPFNTSVIIGDGRNEQRGVRIRTEETGITPPLRYDLAFEEFNVKRPGVLYDSRPDLRNTLKVDVNLIKSNANLASLYTIANKPPYVANGKNILNIVFDNELLNISVNKADSLLEAYKKAPLLFNMQLLLP